VETPGLTTDLDISIDQMKIAGGIEIIYNTLVLREREGSFVRFTHNDLILLLGMAKEQVPTDVHLKLQRQEHFLQCLDNVYDIFFNPGDDFDHNIKFSISALCEVLFNSLDFIYGEIPRKSFWRSGTRYFTPDIKCSMVANGWCPSDISRGQGRSKVSIYSNIAYVANDEQTAS
jgi:hypothetical protein